MQTWGVPGRWCNGLGCIDEALIESALMYAIVCDKRFDSQYIEYGLLYGKSFRLVLLDFAWPRYLSDNKYLWSLRGDFVNEQLRLIDFPRFGLLLWTIMHEL
jgi:hypothetical protein